MAKTQTPVTTAVRALRQAGVAFEPHVYAYEEKGGTRVSGRELGVDEHTVVKTLVMEDDAKEPLIVLMHGDLQVSTKELARRLGRRRVVPCDAATAEKHTGFQVGGTSPFGTRRALPVYVERTILELPRIFINGGKRGFLVAIDPAELTRVLGAEPVDASQPS